MVSDHILGHSLSADLSLSNAGEGNFYLHWRKTTWLHLLFVCSNCTKRQIKEIQSWEGLWREKKKKQTFLELRIEWFVCSLDKNIWHMSGSNVFFNALVNCINKCNEKQA